MRFHLGSFLLLCTCASLALSQYDPQAALEYVYASSLAYCTPAQINDWNCGPPCTNLSGYSPLYVLDAEVQTNENISFSMIHNPEQQRVILTFRGTDSNYQLLLEGLEGEGVYYTLHNISGALIDTYFQSRYISYVRSDLFNQLNEAITQFPDYEFVFTGHSLGGAMATVAIHDVVLSGLLTSSQVALYNFGSPRVGNYAYAQSVVDTIATIYRVVHYKDLVPHIPPCQMSLDFSECINETLFGNTPGVIWPAWHIWSNIFYTDESSENWVLCNGGEDMSCANQYTIQECNVNDHLHYLGVHITCDPSATSGSEGEDSEGEDSEEDSQQSGATEENAEESSDDENGWGWKMSS